MRTRRNETSEPPCFRVWDQPRRRRPFEPTRIRICTNLEEPTSLISSIPLSKLTDERRSVDFKKIIDEQGFKGKRVRVSTNQTGKSASIDNIVNIEYYINGETCHIKLISGNDNVGSSNFKFKLCESDYLIIAEQAPSSRDRNEALLLKS